MKDDIMYFSYLPKTHRLPQSLLLQKEEGPLGQNWLSEKTHRGRKFIPLHEFIHYDDLSEKDAVDVFSSIIIENF